MFASIRTYRGFIILGFSIIGSTIISFTLKLGKNMTTKRAFILFTFFWQTLVFSLASQAQAGSETVQPINSEKKINVDQLVLPQHDGVQHLGVASCAASMCHGSAIPRSGSDVLQNEYVVWSKHDAHAQAYQTLLTPASKKIADKLGLAKAHQAKVCLDCHADNIQKTQQGEKFQLSDGVGCEACHGGGEHYISSHTNTKLARDEKILNGLLAIDRPQVRANICLSCHLGNKDKFASHDIMGAGHPRLAFELDTFGILQPLHYVVDDDYKAKKWFGNSYITWLYGQFSASRVTLNLIENKLMNKTSLFPELSLFDCHSCHHPMDNIKWNKTKGQGFKPGTVRLNDGNLKMLMAISSITPLKNKLHQDIADVSRHLNDKTLLVNSIANLRSDIEQLQHFFAQQSVQQQQVDAKKVLLEILTMGGNRAFSDYIAAEQTVMAIDLLLVTVELREHFDVEIKQLFELVNNENDYQAQVLTSKTKSMLKKLKKL
ncbi:MAG: cytochrome c family protein [Thalassotalea sp.]